MVTEVMSETQIPLMMEYADVMQVGSRNIAIQPAQGSGRNPKPVLLKRGLAATIDEFLWAAEYVLAGGNDQSDPLRARYPSLIPSPATYWIWVASVS
ncbi:MAG: hypothetical protein R2857_06990 [Vampirovibrionales bacterium]